MERSTTSLTEATTAGIYSPNPKIIIELYHYCLMPNHFHLLLKIQKAGDLAELMHHTQLAYARYLKKTRAFKRNPVKAELAQEASAYPYSSAPFYVLGTRDPLVTSNPYYAQMGKTGEERQQRYREFLSFDEPYAQMLDATLAKT